MGDLSIPLACYSKNNKIKYNKNNKTYNKNNKTKTNS